MKWSTLCLGAVFIVAVTATMECQADVTTKDPFKDFNVADPKGSDYDFGRIIRDTEGKISGVGRNGDLKGAEYNPCNSKTPPSWCPKIKN